MERSFLQNRKTNQTHHNNPPKCQNKHKQSCGKTKRKDKSGSNHHKSGCGKCGKHGPRTRKRNHNSNHHKSNTKLGHMIKEKCHTSHVRWKLGANMWWITLKERFYDPSFAITWIQWWIALLERFFKWFPNTTLIDITPTYLKCNPTLFLYLINVKHLNTEIIFIFYVKMYSSFSAHFIWLNTTFPCSNLQLQAFFKFSSMQISKLSAKRSTQPITTDFRYVVERFKLFSTTPILLDNSQNWLSYACAKLVSNLDGEKPKLA